MAMISNNVPEHQVCPTCQEPNDNGCLHGLNCVCCQALYCVNMVNSAVCQTCTIVCDECHLSMDPYEFGDHQRQCQDCKQMICEHLLVAPGCVCEELLCRPCFRNHVEKFTCCTGNPTSICDNYDDMQCIISLAEDGRPYGHCSTILCNAYLCPSHLVNSRNDPFDKDKWFCRDCIKVKLGVSLDRKDKNIFCYRCMTYDGTHCLKKCHESHCSDCRQNGLMCAHCSMSVCGICYSVDYDRGSRHAGGCDVCKTLIVPGLNELSSFHTKGNQYFSIDCNDIILAYLGMFTSGSVPDMRAIMYKSVRVIRDTEDMSRFFQTFSRWMPSSLKKFRIPISKIFAKHWNRNSYSLHQCAAQRVAQVTSETYLQSLNFDWDDNPCVGVVKWWFNIFVQVMHTKEFKCVSNCLRIEDVYQHLTTSGPSDKAVV
jgi:hypothetical protein